jgi:hypothetical protein
MKASTMATSVIRPARLIGAAMLLCSATVIAAQDNRNSSFQVGQVNINRTWQCGETNQNSTYQDGRININQTRQGCRDQSPKSPRSADKQALKGQRLGAEISAARAASGRRR